MNLIILNILKANVIFFHYSAAATVHLERAMSFYMLFLI